MIKFNLLPKGTNEKNAERKQKTAALLLSVLVVGLLGVAYVTQLGRVASYESDREDAEEILAQLEGEITELQPFADLRDDRALVDTLLVRAFGNEVSMTETLEQLGATLPDDAWWETLNVTLYEEEERPLGSEELVIGRASMTGINMEMLEPGVRSMVADFNAVDLFANTFLTTAFNARDDFNATGREVEYFLETDLTQMGYTLRYLEGIPEELMEQREALESVLAASYVPCADVDLNTATFEELQEIIEIDQVRAQVIIDNRPFSSVEDLVEVDGIADERLSQIQAEGIACVGTQIDDEQ